MGALKNFFSKKTTTETTRDPFADALVSISSNDPNVFVSGSVLRNSDVYAAVSLIAGDLASNPIKSGSDLYDKMLNERPNSLMSAYAFRYALAVELLLNGNSYAEIDLSTHSLDFIPNNKMTVLEDDATSEVKYLYSPDGRTKRYIDPSNILHFKHFTRDGVVGIPPLFALKDELDIQNAGNYLMDSFFKNGIHGTTLVQLQKSELSPENAENIRKKFDSANSGNNAMKTVVVDDSMTVKTLPLNTDVLKLVNSNDWATRQIAKAFGIPPEKLGVENDHSNQEQSNLQYLQGGLAHYEQCFISEFNYKLNQTFSYDNSNLLNLDPQVQQQQAVDGYTNGIYTRNEARALLNLPPVDNGDDFVSNEKVEFSSTDENSTLNNNSEGGIETDGNTAND